MAIRSTQLDTYISAKTKLSSHSESRIYKRFFDRFQTESEIFLTHIKGITDNDDLKRYASLMLTRLMFLYFIQHKGFLDQDTHYLPNRLKTIQSRKDAGLNFYHNFLLNLFHDGLSKQALPPELTASIGNVPFLNIDLFKGHPIERDNSSTIQIPDEAFERVLAFFDTYRWELDDLPGNENTITPGILGYIFEKQINQKQMGAYYTQRDITEYIAKNAIIPLLFNAVEKKYPAAFLAGAPTWQLLQKKPDRYIYPAVKKGVELPLPSEIAEGLSDVSRREDWNKAAPDVYALPTETWREVIARRQQYHERRTQLETGAVHSIDDLLTNNLDIRKLAQDVIENCEEPGLLHAFYESISNLTVLDPTCGTGAFLFAALDILEPLYMACLNRMGQMESIDSPGGGQPRHFFSKHSNRRYSIFKSIMLSNLYGVDIMEEATEICKLRLFLKLLAQIKQPEEIEPLPNLDVNIRAGNILIGSDSYPDSGFDVIIGNPPYIEYKPVSAPYNSVNYTTLSTGNLYALTMERCASLLAPGGRFGMIVPASATCTDGFLPLQHLLLDQSSLHISSFSDQRGKLFKISHPRLCIITFQKPPGPKRVFSTSYLKPERELRESLFQRLEYTEVTMQVRPGVIPRYGSQEEPSLHAKLNHQSQRLGDYLCKTGTHTLYFTRKLSWFVQVTPFIPRIIDAQGNIRNPSELKTLRFSSVEHLNIAFAALNSNLFYWFVTTGSDCRNLNMREVLGLPLNIDEMSIASQRDLGELAARLTIDLQAHSRLRTMSFKDMGTLTIQCTFPGKSKHIIDEIDRVLAQHYGFTSEELDFIINYDIKYRLWRS